MSKYTTEVRFVCETYAGLDESEGYSNVKDIIETARPKVFDFDYPIFDEAYRPVLETKIIMHYYTREICEETVGLWKLRLMSKLNEIMPYYNKLYESELLKFNPLYDTDYYREGDRNGKQDSTRDDTTNRNSKAGGQDVTNTANRDKYSHWDLYSDTPQGGIEGILGAEDEPSLLDNGYLTNARHVLHDGDGTTGNAVTNYGRTDDTDSVGKSVFDGRTTEDYAEHVYGKMPGKSYPRLLQEFRDTFLNIDVDVINELRNLFLNLW